MEEGCRNKEGAQKFPVSGTSGEEAKFWGGGGTIRSKKKNHGGDERETKFEKSKGHARKGGARKRRK